MMVSTANTTLNEIHGIQEAFGQLSQRFEAERARFNEREAYLYNELLDLHAKYVCQATGIDFVPSQLFFRKGVTYRTFNCVKARRIQWARVPDLEVNNGEVALNG